MYYFEMDNRGFKVVSRRNFPDGEKITVSIRLPESLKKALEACAADAGRGFSDFVQEGLDQWAAAHRPKTVRR